MLRALPQILRAGAVVYQQFLSGFKGIHDNRSLADPVQHYSTCLSVCGEGGRGSGLGASVEGRGRGQAGHEYECNTTHLSLPAHVLEVTWHGGKLGSLMLAELYLTVDLL